LVTAATPSAPALVDRKMISDQLLDAMWGAKYIKSVSTLYGRADLGLRIFIAVTTSSTVISWAFWSSIPQIWQGISIISTVLAIASPLLKLSDKLESFGQIYGHFAKIETATDKLLKKKDCGKDVTLDELEQAEGDPLDPKLEMMIPERKNLMLETQHSIKTSMGVTP